jgi:hypothetical protein
MFEHNHAVMRCKMLFEDAHIIDSSKTWANLKTFIMLHAKNITCGEGLTRAEIYPQVNARTANPLPVLGDG